jgi:hypothetical protein
MVILEVLMQTAYRNIIFFILAQFFIPACVSTPSGTQLDNFSKFNINRIEVRQVVFNNTLQLFQGSIGPKTGVGHSSKIKYLNPWRTSLYNDYFKKHIANTLKNKGYVVSFGPDIDIGNLDYIRPTGTFVYIPDEKIYSFYNKVDNILNNSPSTADAILVFGIIKLYTNIDEGLSSNAEDGIFIRSLTVGWFLYNVALKKVIINDHVPSRIYIEKRNLDTEVVKPTTIGVYDYLSLKIHHLEDMDAYCKRFIEGNNMINKLPNRINNF